MFDDVKMLAVKPIGKIGNINVTGKTKDIYIIIFYNIYMLSNKIEEKTSTVNLNKKVIGELRKLGISGTSLNEIVGRIVKVLDRKENAQVKNQIINFENSEVVK